MRRMGDEDDPRSSCGRLALGLPSTVLEDPAGELDSNEVEGDLDRFIESDSAEGDAPPGEAATGELEPMRRS